jgi:hypothetical protein
MGPYTFTTGSDVSAVNLALKPRGLGGTVDLDGVGLWRGTGIGDTADPRRSCQGGMLNAGDYCIDPVSAGLSTRGVSWHESARACRVRGRRLCSADELSMAMYMGVVAANDQNVTGSFQSFTDAIGYNGSVNQAGLIVSLNVNAGWGEVGYGTYQYGTWSYIGRLCCTSR